MIIDLSCVSAADIALVGGKGANLGEMLRAGLPVPDGFCVTVDAYRAAVSGLDELTADTVANAPLPPGMADELREAVARIGGPVAVRSSATAEDLPDASFAGQQETFLGVVRDDVPDAVRRCWASLWGERAVAYRKAQGYGDDVALAVVVQTMVRADAAGVAFTVDPVTGRREVTVEAALGLGESVVSGAVTPDSYRVGRRVQTRLGDKRTRIDLRADGSTITTAVCDPAAPSIDEATAKRVAALARKVERYYGRPMDIEWAVEDDRLWLLQARPVTVVGQRPSKAGQWIHDDIIEHFPAPYPLDTEVTQRTLNVVRGTLAGAGIEIEGGRELVQVDGDGLARLTPPHLRLRRPWRLLSALLPDRCPDSADWGMAPFRELTDWVASTDVAALPDAELVALLRHAMDQAADLLQARARNLLPYGLRGVLLGALLKLSRSKLEPFDLLAGVDYVSTDVNRAIADLVASADDDVRAALAARPVDVAAVRSTAWWGDLEVFLDRFGARTTRMYQVFSSRSWREDLPGFLSLLGGQPPAPAVPPAVPWIVPQRLLARYRAGHVMREASVLAFEELGCQLRRLAHEAGRRLGLTPDEVVYLTFEELTGAVTRGHEVRPVVDRRRAQRHRAQAAWTAGIASHSSGSGGGVAASPGRATGPARIVRGPEDFDRLQPGDVLVCPATDPAWTPLFARAVAVVAQTGSRLSHAAIVAREYGIPAVLGMAGALNLPDGAVIDVDGSAGTVRVRE